VKHSSEENESPSRGAQKINKHFDMYSPQKYTPNLLISSNKFSYSSHNYAYKLPSYWWEFTNYSNKICDNPLWIRCKNKKPRREKSKHEYWITGSNWELKIDKSSIGEMKSHTVKTPNLNQRHR
jgi:hypothetical protein